MNALPPQAVKLLDYALCFSASPAEAQNAFVRALPALHNAGIDNTAKLASAIGLPAVVTHIAPTGSETFFPFGKHAGESVRDVWQRSRSYCRWFRTDIDPESSEKYADLIAEIHDAIDQLESEAKR